MVILQVPLPRVTKRWMTHVLTMAHVHVHMYYWSMFIVDLSDLLGALAEVGLDLAFASSSSIVL